VDDMAAACVFLMELDGQFGASATRPLPSRVNVGSGLDCTTRELAQTVGRIVGFTGPLRFDASRPDGAPRKLTDVSVLKALGWQAGIDLETGLTQVVRWYQGHASRASA
jgi:GDP-L-fucose synthase